VIPGSRLSGESRENLDEIAPMSVRAWLRYDIIQRMMPAGVRSVLEIGCGRGALGVRLARHYAYLGIEPDEASRAVARKRVSAVGAGEVRGSLEGLSRQQFDLVCAFEVLEHIEDDAAALRDWVSWARPSGWLMLSIPADQHRYGPMDQLVGHFRRYGPAELTELLASCGLNDIVVRRYNFPLGQLIEAGHNLVDGHWLAGAPDSAAERTAASGRLFQPGGGLLGSVNRWGTAPFRQLQRLFPGKGTGLVAVARVSG
jgi:SAM-dependent methyltransferase